MRRARDPTNAAAAKAATGPGVSNLCCPGRVKRRAQQLIQPSAT